MIDYNLRRISTVILDVDGVLSTNTIAMDAVGRPVRSMNIKDGYSIQLAAKQGLRLAIITGGKDEAVLHRYSNLGVRDIFMGVTVKISVYEEYCKKYGLSDDEIIYVGDDIPDYEIMQKVGCPCAPSDACPDIKAISRYISPYPGGNGCVRDILEQVLRAKGLWLSSATAFGW